MNKVEHVLCRLLDDSVSDLGELSASELATLYTSSAFLQSGLFFLKDQLWLGQRSCKEKGKKIEYSDFLSPLLKEELTSLSFLERYLREESGHKKLWQEAIAIEKNTLDEVCLRAGAEKKRFLIQSLKGMMKYFIHEEAMQVNHDQSLGHRGPELYRIFDGLDRVFALDYHRDQEMKTHRGKERLYERTGVGVQSGYSTILLALHHLRHIKEMRIIDLGSGYGRVGLVWALLRPDIHFTGYEYVPHRVEVANRACRDLGLTPSLVFVAQDLSCQSFTIPEAEVYYLYDPFSEDTYHHVLNQLIEVSQKIDIRVVTKGNARAWLTQVARENDWGEALIIDEGNLCIFNSSL